MSGHRAPGADPLAAMGRWEVVDAACLRVHDRVVLDPRAVEEYLTFRPCDLDWNDLDALAFTVTGTVRRGAPSIAVENMSGRICGLDAVLVLRRLPDQPA